MDQTTAQQPAAKPPRKKRKTAEDKRQELLELLRERADKRGTDKLSREQQLALYIAGLPERSERDEDMLRTILDAERAAILARRKKAKATQVTQAEAEKERKARTRRLIEFGGLVDIAGVGEYDRAVLLGMLASIPDLHDQERENMRQRGVELFAEREAAKAAERARREEQKASQAAKADQEPGKDRYGNPVGS